MALGYASTHSAALSVACPHCKAGPANWCTTPNGWRTLHKARIRAASGEALAAPKLGALSDAQAQRIERAAQHDGIWVPNYAMFRGNRAEITVAEKLAEKGLLTLAESTDTERRFVLTVTGWRVYREHRLVIRRLPAEEIDAGEAAAAARDNATKETT